MKIRIKKIQPFKRPAYYRMDIVLGSGRVCEVAAHLGNRTEVYKKLYEEFGQEADSLELEWING